MDDELKTLRQDADQAAGHVGYMRSIIDNGTIADRLDGSVSGQAWLLGKVAVEQALIMYCARAWDSAPDAVTLPQALKALPPIADLNARRAEWNKGLGIVEPAPDLTAEFDAFQAGFATVEAMAAHRHMRVLRSERFAHRVIASRDRKKFEASGPIIDATIAELIDLSQRTVTLVGDLGYLWDGLVNPYPDMIDRSERYSREFWDHLPVYREVEKAD